MQEDPKSSPSPGARLLRFAMRVKNGSGSSEDFFRAGGLRAWMASGMVSLACGMGSPISAKPDEDTSLGAEIE